MKKALPILIVITLISILTFFYFNQNYNTSANESEDDSQYLIYTSIYPIYETARKIAGENLEIGLVVPNGTEAHSYEPSPRKIADLESADLFLYIGIGMEPWADKATAILDDSNIRSVELSNYLDLINYNPDHEVEENHSHTHEDSLDSNHSDEEDIAGEHEKVNEHTHEEDIMDTHTHEEDKADINNHEEDIVNTHDHGHDNHGSYDPHVWLDPMNMEKIAEVIKDELISLDPDNREVYIANYDTYSEKIHQIDEEYRRHLSEKTNDTIIVSHAAFGYLARRYEFKQKAIAGLTSHEESTPGNIASLIDFARENDVDFVFRETLVDNHAVRVLAEEAELEILSLNPFIGLTEEEQEKGEDYFSIMSKNLRNLEKALVN
ncbi:MAG: metal ABC transporter solute-binding protein, Zn/Mn family [Halanaerobiales bacterium]